MMLDRQVRRVFRWRRYAIIGLVLIGALVAAFGDQIFTRLSPVCDAPPDYAADVPADVRTRLDALHEAGLLYCGDVPEGLRDVPGPVYWGSDGLLSVLFFQADQMRGIGVRSYRFADDIGLPPGDFRPPGFKVTRPAFLNQAPEGASFYVYVGGAPSPSTGAVTVRIVGPAKVYGGLGSRNIYEDIDMAWRWIRRLPVNPGTTAVTVAMPIAPVRWEELVTLVETPELTEDALGQLLYKTELPTPALLRTASSLLASSVWVAGVISGTNPSLVLAPPGGQPIEPFSGTVWYTQSAPMRLKVFVFERQPDGATHEARFWQDPEARGVAEPDYTWQATFP